MRLEENSIDGAVIIASAPLVELVRQHRAAAAAVNHYGGAMIPADAMSAARDHQDINPHGLYDTAGVAKILGLHPDTVYRIPRALLRRTPVGPRGGRTKIMGSDLLLYLRRG